MKDYTVFLGDVALDEYYRADCWPEAGGKAFVDQMEAKHGGMIANAACVYSAAGGDARFMTTLNSGEVSRVLVEGLEKQGVSPVYVITDDSLADSKCMIFLAKDNNTVMILNTGLISYELTEEYLNVLKDANCLYTTLSDLLRMRFGNMEGLEIAHILRQNGVQIFCDLDTGYLDEEKEIFYQELDYAVFNHIGFRNYRGKRTEEEAAQQLLSYGVKAVVITCGIEGCRLYSEKMYKTIPAFQVEAADVTGAGDTFSASFLYGIQRFGEDYEKAAEYASAAAAICVSGVGARAGAVSENEVRCFLKKQGLDY